MLQKSKALNLKTEYLNIIGDILFEIIQKDAKKRKRKTSKTRNIFQSATEDDVENRKNARYINNYDLSGEISDFFLETRRKKTVQSFLQKLEDEMEDKKCEIDPKMEYKRDELPYCLNCGAEINNFELIIFCPYCGTKIVSSEDEPDTDEENDTLVDFDDEDIKTLFDEEEWKELTKDPIRIPPIPHEIAKELTKYRKKILKELRAVIIALYLKEKEEYDVNKHYEREWIQMTLRTLCNLYENVDAPLIRSQYEDWFTVALFGTCIDFCIRDIQLGTDIKRTDAPSLSSANRKNRGRKANTFGAIEGARSYSGASDQKYLLETFKMLKTLRNMYADLMKAVDYDDQKASKIQVKFYILDYGSNLLGYSVLVG
ncbi:c2h2-type zinc finger transcription factor [Gigaspora margarita]|uniref:C2h2-type zinc finger transcription factor n=1 Tax=Gigaspora margarita TaxID=4874 RepID=A0A8H4EJ88_GIGMA|nr:c2h2-type zinc finger transcription factor [Gigaspora margarita]